MFQQGGGGGRGGINKVRGEERGRGREESLGTSLFLWRVAKKKSLLLSVSPRGGEICLFATMDANEKKKKYLVGKKRESCYIQLTPDIYT